MAGYNTTQNRMIASRAIISVLALWLAFSGVAAAEQLYVNESGWWREGGVFNVSTAPIQAAVGAAGEGDSIYVFNGSYTENVNVNEPLTLEGEGADVVTVTAVSSGDPVFWVTANYVDISGFAVRGATDSDMAGIYLDDVDYCNISRTDVYGNFYGIYLYYSSSNTLTGNTASGNWDGISLYYSSSNNTLRNNTANSNNAYGIFMDSSSNNTLTGNTASNNGNGISLYFSSSNTLTGNTASGNNGDGIFLLSSSSNTLRNNTANSNNGSTASNNGDSTASSSYGIYLYYLSNNNTLTGNTASGNNGGGIFLVSSSSNTLRNNTANSNIAGISLDYSSSNNTLTENIANSNNYNGISLYSSSSNNITCNLVQNNTQYGFRLYNADNNNITCNLVKNNTERGFYIHSGSTGNDVSYNNIIENGNYNAATGGWEWQFYIDQYNPVEAKHNYWGAGMNSSTIDASIYDDEEGEGKVEFYPFETESVSCAPGGPDRPAFITADAVIALQIAAGSRPPDLRWDVSGDKRVTSLDALMILQAAAGGIEIG